jgi:hypothetical protein
MSSADYSMEPRLPRDHPLAGCQEKLWRAHEHFDLLQEEIAKLQTGEIQLATFRTKPKPNVEKTLWTVVESVTEPNLRLATILGDMIHNLRSSLDNLVFELAFLGMKGKKIPVKTAFPSSETRTNWNSPYVQNVLLEGVLKKHRAILYQTQPCYRKRDFASVKARSRRKRNPTADLNNLWNEDKHRMVQPVVLTPFQIEPVIGPFRDCRPVGKPTINIDFLGCPVEADTEVLSIPIRVTGHNPGVKVQIKITGEISLRNGFPVLNAMMDIGNYVRAIIARFEPIFETPQARRLWGLPRGGWVEREPARWGRTTRQGWAVTSMLPPS